MKCEINKILSNVRFFVTEGSQRTIRGLEACNRFSLIKKIGSVNSVKKPQFGEYQKLLNSYNDVFEGLGCLPGECQIILKESAVPQVDPPRRVSFKLMSQ